VEIVRLLHSWGRWLVLLVLAVGLLWALLGWLRKRPLDPLSPILLKVFNAVLGVEFLLGLGLLFGLGVERHRLEHGAAMLVAVLLTGILPRRWRTRLDHGRHRNQFVLLLVVLALILAGVLRLPANIQWRFFT
jgi:hypothetical protein